MTSLKCAFEIPVLQQLLSYISLLSPLPNLLPTTDRQCATCCYVCAVKCLVERLQTIVKDRQHSGHKVQKALTLLTTDEYCPKAERFESSFMKSCE